MTMKPFVEPIKIALTDSLILPNLHDLQNSSCRLFLNQTDIVGRTPSTLDVNIYQEPDKENVEYFRVADNIYELLLEKCIEVYEELFDLGWPPTSWRIFLGPWLSNYVHSTCDRVWKLESLLRLKHTCATTTYRDSCMPAGTRVLTSAHYEELIKQSPDFNQLIYTRIIHSVRKYKDSIRLDYADDMSHARLFQELASKRYTRFIRPKTKKPLLSIFSAIFNVLNIFRPGNSSTLISDFYLGFERSMKLALKLPKAKHLKLQNVHSDLDFIQATNQEKRSFLAQKVFRDLGHIDPTLYTALKVNFLHSLPISLLESIEYYAKDKIIRHYSQEYRNILSSMDLYGPDFCKFILAEHKAKGSRLIYCQHGGYAIPQYLSIMQHELKCSSIYLTWGWSSEDVDRKMYHSLNERDLAKIKPLGCQLPQLMIKRQIKSKKYCFIRSQYSQYPCNFQSNMPPSTTITAIRNCMEVIRTIKIYSPSDFSVRLGPRDYGYNEREAWETYSPGVTCIEQSEPIETTLARHQLIIYTYNCSTGWLQYLMAGIPTCLFFDPVLTPVDHNFAPLLEQLEKVGLFHPSTASLTQFLQREGQSPLTWLNSPTTQSVLRQLLKRYCSPVPLITIYQQIKEHTKLVQEQLHP